MHLGQHILELLAPVSIGETIAGARLSGVSTELGVRLTFEKAGQYVHVELALAGEGRRFAASTRHLHVSYRVGDGGRPVDPALGMELCRRVAALASRHEERVLAAIAESAAAAREEAADGGARVREVRVDRVLERAGSPERGHYTLSPYVGCLIGCRFCYAQGRLAGVRRLERLPEVPWGSYVDARINAAEVLARELASLPRAPIKFCPIVSDPYQAVERRYGLTRRCLEVIRDAPSRPPAVVLTRARLLERDADVLAAIPAAHGGASIPTIDDEVRRHFEPRAAPIADRLAALAALRAAGVRTFAVVQPLLPGSIPDLADALAEVVESVSIDVLHGVEGAGADFEDPRYRACADAAWQADRAAELAAALARHGVAIWEGDLPPAVAAQAGPA